MARAAARPLWLAISSRYAGRPRRNARWLLGLLALLLLASLAVQGSDTAPSPMAESSIQGTEILLQGVVEDIRHGADYYTATAQTLRAMGAPVNSLLVFRLPTLGVLQAAISPVAAALLLYGLALATLLVWWRRLQSVFSSSRARVVAVLLAAIGMMSAILGHLLAMHDLWAGLLIALSLASRLPGRWITAAALGLSAALIRETAVLYLSVMMILALLEGQRREAIGWLAALSLFATVLAFHAQAVAQAVGPAAEASTGWIGAAGFGFAVQSVVATTALSLAPAVIAALAAVLAIAGWSSWRDPLATRALTVIVVQLLVMTFFGTPDRVHWSFLIAPIVPIGLVFVPDALRDLARSALDRRRITVTRTAA
ncbi:hypothetical protein SAMN05428950_101356 [Sphingomonas sp. OV641]|uniref:hypothetical protein n=1 Tax=Sphingomonas sp. OV641 TaxID=1881068 RepID=UPI0008CC3B65|nr:hypothetical protein [Sphingomonas sp. OV641]SEI84143.1 hypothetical protein SAMN05428950_101356 [Sphingomonas sp. OV641]